MNTLLLDRSTWDLVPDAYGNIAMATNPYALAQDAASAIKLFQGELYYNTFKGIPYWVVILGKAPPVGLMKSYFIEAAMTVPEIASAKCFIDGFVDRKVRGQVQTTDTQGNTSVAAF